MFYLRREVDGISLSTRGASIIKPKNQAPTRLGRKK